MLKYLFSTTTLVFLATSVTANEVSQLKNNNPVEIITVTAERTSVSELLSPYSTSLIYEDEIIKKGYRTTVDALSSVSGVFLQKTGHGQGSPYIRGFTGFRNVFLIDGIRLNNSVFREGPNQYWNTVDSYSIAKFEVVKGSTSVAYGSDAIGGTVNAITKFQVLNEFDEQPLTFLAYRGSTAEQSNVFRASHQNKITNNSGISLGFSVKNFGNLIAGGDTNEQHNTDYKEFNIDLKWLLSLDDNLQLTTAFFKTVQDDVPRTHKTIHSKSFVGTTVGSELARDLNQERQLLYIKLDAKQQTVITDTAQFTISYQQQNEVRDRTRTENRYDQQGFSVNTLGFSVNLAKRINANQIVYGFEYYRDNIDSFSSSNKTQGPVADNAAYHWLGFYGQNKYNLNSKTSIDFGTRWSYQRVSANRVHNPINSDVIAINKKWHNTIFSLRGNHQLKPQSTSIYLGVAQGFRAPNLSDLTRLDSARSNEFEIPSLQLKPEYYLSVDSGIKFRSHKLNYDISIFYTDISDQIQRVPTGITNSDGEFEITKENIGNGYTYGSEIDIQYFLNKQLKLTARMAYIKGKIDTFPRSDNILENDYISRLMPTNLNLAIDYSAESGEWWLNTSMTAFDKADRLSARDKLDTQRIPPKGTPGFIIWNISGGYTISKATQLTVNLHNMLDKNYRIHGSGQNEAGRNLVVSIEYLF